MCWQSQNSQATVVNGYKMLKNKFQTLGRIGHFHSSHFYIQMVVWTFGVLEGCGFSSKIAGVVISDATAQ